jgi:hypothetical protein
MTGYAAPQRQSGAETRHPPPCLRLTPAPPPVTGRRRLRRLPKGSFRAGIFGRVRTRPGRIRPSFHKKRPHRLRLSQQRVRFTPHTGCLTTAQPAHRLHFTRRHTHGPRHHGTAGSSVAFQPATHTQAPHHALSDRVLERLQEFAEAWNAMTPFRIVLAAGRAR